MQTKSGFSSFQLFFGVLWVGAAAPALKLCPPQPDVLTANHRPQGAVLTRTCRWDWLIVCMRNFFFSPIFIPQAFLGTRSPSGYRRRRDETKWNHELPKISRNKLEITFNHVGGQKPACGELWMIEVFLSRSLSGAVLRIGRTRTCTNKKQERDTFKARR